MAAPTGESFLTNVTQANSIHLQGSLRFKASPHLWLYTIIGSLYCMQCEVINLTITCITQIHAVPKPLTGVSCLKWVGKFAYHTVVPNMHF